MFFGVVFCVVPIFLTQTGDGGDIKVANPVTVPYILPAAPQPEAVLRECGFSFLLYCAYPPS